MKVKALEKIILGMGGNLPKEEEIKEQIKAQHEQEMEIEENNPDTSFKIVEDVLEELKDESFLGDSIKEDLVSNDLF